MSQTKKNTTRRSAAKRVEQKTVIVTKTTLKDDASFSKKVKAMNALLAKATLLSSC